MNLQQLDRFFKEIAHLKVLIIGDVMVDNYMWGEVSRMSPEAPVPVVSIAKREQRLGGAANVAINIKALGAEPWLCTVTGNDANAKIFEKLMNQMGIKKGVHLNDEARVTTTKTRVIGNKHHMIRVDEEHCMALSKALEEEMISGILTLIADIEPDVVIFEDYDKGCITPAIISDVVSFARDQGIPVTVDPKRRQFNAYKGVTLFKPNLKELIEGSGIVFNHKDIDAIRSAASELRTKQNHQISLITLSEKGMLLTTEEEQHLLSAHVRSVADVSGAGDTVISVASLGLAYGLSPYMAGVMANLAGGLVCEHVGVVPVNTEVLYEECSRLIRDMA